MISMPSMFPPPWLTLILDSKFYENCDEHEGTLCNFFCIDCSEVFCESCKQEHDDEGHKVLQVSFFFVNGGYFLYIYIYIYIYNPNFLLSYILLLRFFFRFTKLHVTMPFEL